LQHASALNEPYHEDDDGDHQQQMDESPTDVKGEESEKPQDQQDHEDRPEHDSLLLFGNPPENFDYASVRDLARGEPKPLVLRPPEGMQGIRQSRRTPGVRFRRCLYFQRFRAAGPHLPYPSSPLGRGGDKEALFGLSPLPPSGREGRGE